MQLKMNFSFEKNVKGKYNSEMEYVAYYRNLGKIVLILNVTSEMYKIWDRKHLMNRGFLGYFYVLCSG